jgi:hypothetical protein
MLCFTLITLVLSSFHRGRRGIQSHAKPITSLASISEKIESVPTSCTSVLEILLQVGSPLDFCTHPSSPAPARAFCTMQKNRVNGSLNSEILASVCSKLSSSKPTAFLESISSKVDPLNLAPSEIGSEPKILRPYLSFDFIRYNLQDSIKQMSYYYENWPKMLALHPLENTLEMFPLTFKKPDEPYRDYQMSGIIFSEDGKFIPLIISESFDFKSFKLNLDFKPELIFYSCTRSAHPWNPVIIYKPPFLALEADSVFEAAQSLLQVKFEHPEIPEVTHDLQDIEDNFTEFSTHLKLKGRVFSGISSGISVHPHLFPEEIIGQLQTLLSTPFDFCLLAKNKISQSHTLSPAFISRGIVCLFKTMLTILEMPEDRENLRTVQTRLLKKLQFLLQKTGASLVELVDLDFGPTISTAKKNPSRSFLNVKMSQRHLGTLESLSEDPDYEKILLAMKKGNVTWPKYLVVRFEKSKDQLNAVFHFDHSIEFDTSIKYRIYSVWGYNHIEREHMQIINKEEEGLWKYINKNGEIQNLKDEEIERMQTRTSPTWLIYLQMD